MNQYEKGLPVSAFGNRQMLAQDNVTRKWPSFEDPSWKKNHYIGGFSLPALASGATSVAPTADSLGGVNLDADTEYLYDEITVSLDWDEVSVPYIEIYFETDQDNSGGDITDRVTFEVLYYLKALEESRQRIQTITKAYIIGRAERYTLYKLEFPLVLTGANAPRPNDHVAARIRFVATSSGITDVIVTDVHWHYLAQKVSITGT